MTYLASLLPLAAIYGILVVGLNLQFGMTGILNFTYITFVAVGAYISGVLSMGPSHNGLTYVLGANVPFPFNVLAGGLAAAIMGFFISFTALRRLRSDYLAIVTIAAGEIVYTIAGNETALFNGWTGLFNVPVPAPGSLSPAMQQLFFGGLCLLVLAAVMVFAQRVQSSPLGRILRSIRDDETVTEAFGRDVYRTKLLIFFVGSFVAGLGGGLLVEYSTAYNPAAFLPTETFILWAALLIGGAGNNWGAILGALIVPVGFTEATRFLPAVLNNTLMESLRGVAIGLLIIVVPIVLPHGIIRERPLIDRSADMPGGPPEKPRGSIGEVGESHG